MRVKPAEEAGFAFNGVVVVQFGAVEKGGQRPEIDCSACPGYLSHPPSFMSINDVAVSV
jgi:hypothetical protein